MTFTIAEQNHEVASMAFVTTVKFCYFMLRDRLLYNKLTSQNKFYNVTSHATRVINEQVEMWLNSALTNAQHELSRKPVMLINIFIQLLLSFCPMPLPKRLTWLQWLCLVWSLYKLNRIFIRWRCSAITFCIYGRSSHLESNGWNL